MRISVLQLLAATAIALLSRAAAEAAEPLRLDEIAIVRFLEVGSNQWTAQHGMLSSRGVFRETQRVPVLSIVTVPSEAVNRSLVSYEAWLAYSRLGPEAVVNFFADVDGTQYRLGERMYLDVAAVSNPTLTNGRLLALSTRGFVPADEPMIAGFIIEDRPRRVLLRAVGPSLANVGVSTPLADPALTLFQGSSPIQQNDTWGQQANADEIAETASELGLMPLPRESAEAAILLELQPGLYTAHIRPQTGAPGVALFEVYTVTD